MARVAIYLQDKHEIREGMEYAQYAEQRGFEAIWQAESRLVDPLVSAAKSTEMSTMNPRATGTVYK